MHKDSILYKALALLLISLILINLYPTVAVKADAPTAYTFSTIASTGAIVSNGGTSFSQALDVSAIPANQYVFYTVVADYSTSDDAWSSMMNLRFSDGGSTIYIKNINASQGSNNNNTNTTLYWTGVFERQYTGGDNLTIHFTDLDTSGTYTSYLSNVVITLYPSPTTSTTFSSFNTGTISSPGSGSNTPYNKSLDVSHVPDCGYLFYTVIADWTAISPDAHSAQMTMGLNNGGSIVYYPPITARQGGSESSANTTLYWTGMFQREYTGGSPLNITFNDPSTADVYSSSLQNVSVSIYPSPTPPKVFDTFTTTPITGDGTHFIKSLDVTGMAADEYLFLTITANYKMLSGEPYSSDIQMSLNNGAGITYYSQGASQGQLSEVTDTTLYWTGLLSRKYTGGGALQIDFWDSYGGVTYTSQLENVVITIYRAAGTGATAIQLTGLKASNENIPFFRTWQFLMDVFR